MQIRINHAAPYNKGDNLKLDTRLDLSQKQGNTKLRRMKTETKKTH